MKNNVCVVDLKMFTNVEPLAAQHFFERAAGCMPDQTPCGKKGKRASKKHSKHGLSRPQSAVKIDLPKHKIPSLQVSLDSVKPPSRDVKPVVRGVNLDRFDYPFKIEHTVFRSGHERIAQQVIHAVNVELRRNKLSKSHRPKIAANYRRDILGNIRR